MTTLQNTVTESLKHTNLLNAEHQAFISMENGRGSYDIPFSVEFLGDGFVVGSDIVRASVSFEVTLLNCTYSDNKWHWGEYKADASSDIEAEMINGRAYIVETDLYEAAVDFDKYPNGTLSSEEGKSIAAELAKKLFSECPDQDKAVLFNRMLIENNNITT